jgi:signal transduction histidine kinase/DNA-binding response OmpR family regulator
LIPLNFLQRRLSYKGIDEAKLQQRVTSWFTNLGISVFVTIVTIVAAKLEVHSLVLFGLMLLSVYIPNMILQLLFTFRRMWLFHLAHHLQLVVTFYIIVRLGGIHNCGGIILAGLSMVITSISFNSNRWAIWYFSFFVLGIISVAIIQFSLQLPAEMSPRVNHLFFLINTLSLTAYTLVIVLVYLGQFTQIEKDKAESLRELDEFKTKLYTNITHEFRTPLTVILGMTEQIEEEPEKWLKSGLGKIKESSQNLLHLVNQMLDLARLEAGAMPMKMVQNDVIRHLRFLVESFQSMAERNHIHLSFQSEESSFLMDYDPEKLKRIVSNLLSNAIKYNKPEGEVRIGIRTSSGEGDFLIIEVQDTGMGIPQERLELIFDRFYRIEDKGYQKAGGSGLGLAITRELVRLLNGEIFVESDIHKGSLFRIKLPVTRKAPLTEEFENQPEPSAIEVIDSPTQDRAYSSSRNKNLPILLIVEDNQDVSEYLFSLLENDYSIETAGNGKSGLAKAVEMVPDIILSDVMMPEMDGIEMLDRLKKDIRTSHIPVIMLTAKADIVSRLEGFETGAEAYLEKPFNKDELFIRLRKLVELRKELRERYSSFILPEPSGEKQLQLEDSFMHKLHEAFQENLEDEDFGVEQLSNIMAMSRAQLYRKFKALTDRTLMDYLLSFRLHRAMELLQKSELNVTQAAYQVGFKNLSHFSSRFREEYGIKPSEVKQNKS